MKTNHLDVTQVINGKKVEYYEESHAYFVDGIQVPSVTQIVAKMIPSPYQNVEPSILKQAANRGIALHQEIENYETQGLMGSSIEFHHYVELKKRYQIEVIENEKLILIEYQGKVICAGRLDMVAKIKNYNGLGICDIKRTSELHMAHLKLQLNLYRLGYIQSYHQPINHLHCIHLRHMIYQMVELKIDDEYTQSIIKRFLANN